jgi:alkanesulfonate monooxygenase SsuD/methylene tetrahydromethanopterin reductase-like flavin-dependent oxidoreductase (luciferase family)
VIQEHPFNFARKISTLDHASDGRIAWNIVTNALANGARNFGYDELEEHDERYHWADEQVDVAYKLWEGFVGRRRPTAGPGSRAARRLPQGSWHAIDNSRPVTYVYGGRGHDDRAR